MPPKVLLISSVHPSTDPRIIHKIATSLVSRYQVYCILPDANQDEISNSIKMIPVSAFDNLLARVLYVHPVILWKTFRVKPDLIHIFVPELLPVAFLLKCFGIQVIYEVQENLYKKLKTKKRNNALVFELLFKVFDYLARKKFNFVFTEKSYLTQYKKLDHPSETIYNYSSLKFIDQYKAKNIGNKSFPVFLYFGVISLERCLDTLIGALVLFKSVYDQFHVHLYGRCTLKQNEIESIPGYDEVRHHISFYGYTDLRIILMNTNQAIGCIALLKPVGDYYDSYPTKLFEYMSLQLPVITSNFPLYKDVVENEKCGFCINPFDVNQLTEAMLNIAQNPESSLKMGENGRKAVLEKYNWKTEETKLFSFYNKVLKR